MYTSLCIARVFDDHRSWQKLINYITNTKAKSKRYHWIQKIPVLKRLFIQNFCKRSRCLEENPVFLFLSKKVYVWDHIVGFYIKWWCQLEMQKLPHHGT